MRAGCFKKKFDCLYQILTCFAHCRTLAGDIQIRTKRHITVAFAFYYGGKTPDAGHNLSPFNQ